MMYLCFLFKTIQKGRSVDLLLLSINSFGNQQQQQSKSLPESTGHRPPVVWPVRREKKNTHKTRWKRITSPLLNRWRAVRKALSNYRPYRERSKAKKRFSLFFFLLVRMSSLYFLLFFPQVAVMENKAHKVSKEEDKKKLLLNWWRRHGVILFSRCFCSTPRLFFFCPFLAKRRRILIS